MSYQEIIWDTLRHMWIGQIASVFMIEVVFRSLFVYVLLVLSIRAMGKRMASQLSRNELAAMVSLAAAIGIPIQDPQRGLLPALLIAVIIVGFQRYISYRSSRSETFESATQGALDILVCDGTLDLKRMKGSGIGRERLFAQLRREGIKHLGEVRRLYFEANGSFSIELQDEVQCGLSVIPAHDHELSKRMEKAPNSYACVSCGYVAVNKTPMVGNCPKCLHDNWSEAII